MVSALLMVNQRENYFFKICLCNFPMRIGFQNFLVILVTCYTFVTIFLQMA